METILFTVCTAAAVLSIGTIISILLLIAQEKIEV
jgi:hypothetical protein